MREIKFRAWDKARNEFLSSGMILLGVNPSRIPKNSPLYLDIVDGPDMWKARFVLQQYTGLKDKTGREIYEGDIYEVEYFGWKAVVEWDEDNARFLGFTIGAERKIVYVGREPQPVKIIGNIYENPELLNHKS
jgi:hypothetical protein